MDIPEMFRRKLDELTVSDYCGLNSPGLTCYLNSVLQVLFMTEDFCKAVEWCCNKQPSALDQHLHQLFTELRKSEAQTHNVVHTLGITNIYEQHDAAEYFEKILCLTSLDAAKMFRGELNYTTTCVSCKKSIDCHSFFWTLPLVVEDNKKGSSVERGMEAFFEGQKMCGDNQMFCSRCNKKQDAVCQCVMTRPPKILTLLLKRFRFDSKCRSYIKLHTEVTVPQTLFLNSRAYNLYAIVNHYGTIQCGHYLAHIKSYENQIWYQFNDNIVKKMKSQLFEDGATFLSCSTAYLLMYRTVSENTGEADFWKNPCELPDVEEAQASGNWEELQKAAVAKEKGESVNREESCYVVKTAGKLIERGKQEAAFHWQHKNTVDGRKSHIPPQCSRLQEPKGGAPRRCELHRDSSMPPTGHYYRGERPSAEQRRTPRQSKTCSSPAATKTKRRSDHPYERSQKSPKSQK